MRSTYEATATSLAAMRGPGGGRPRRGNDKRAAVEAIPYWPGGQRRSRWLGGEEHESDTRQETENPPLLMG